MLTSQDYLSMFGHRMFPSYRNQSIDLRCKPVSWFLYDDNVHHFTTLRSKGLSYVYFSTLSMLRIYLIEFPFTVIDFVDFAYYKFNYKLYQHQIKS